MPHKKRKVARATDAIIRPDHIHQAQKALAQMDMNVLFKRVHDVEPELAAFTATLAKDLAANVLMDGVTTREDAHRLCQRIVSLCLSVYGAHVLAVVEYYGEIFKGTPLAALRTAVDSDVPAPPPTPATPPQLPPEEEGGAHVR